jgi:hypothetical protein
MTEQTKRTKIVQIAFSAAQCDRKNMIRIPETLSTSFDQAPLSDESETPCAARATKRSKFFDCIESTLRAYAFVAFKDLFPQIARLRSKLPLVNAELRAERESAWRYFE